MLHAGEYPIFNGLDDRVLVPLHDRTSIPDKGFYSDIVEDRFIPHNFALFGGIDEVSNWTLNYAGRSSVHVEGGYMTLKYDGTNVPSAGSTFQLYGDWEVQATLQNSIDPIIMSVTNGDQMVSFAYNGPDWTSTVNTAYCHGVADASGQGSQIWVVEEILIDSNDTANKYTPLGYVPDLADCTSVAININGGPAQFYGFDYVVRDGLVMWEGYLLEAQLDPGDLMRALYLHRNVSGEVRVKISMEDDRITFMLYDTAWKTIMLRDLVGNNSGPWVVSFTMGGPDISVNHNYTAGRGFVSNFTAIADTIVGAGNIRTVGVSTDRRTVIFYKE